MYEKKKEQVQKTDTGVRQKESAARELETQLKDTRQQIKELTDKYNAVCSSTHMRVSFFVARR